MRCARARGIPIAAIGTEIREGRVLSNAGIVRRECLPFYYLKRFPSGVFSSAQVSIFMPRRLRACSTVSVAISAAT